MENLVQGYDGKIQDDENLAIDYSEEFDGKFFQSLNSFESENSKFDLTQIPVEISGLGFDPFMSSKNIPYGFHGELEKIYLKDDEEDIDTADHTNFNSHVSLTVYEDPKEKQKFEEAHQAQKYQEMEEKPDQLIIENSSSIIMV